MRLTPEVLPMLQLRSCQLTLLTSLAFGAVLAVFSAPLTAQTTTIPNLSGYDGETRRTMELACVSEKTRGPVVYGACLNRQIASLQKSPERAVADQRGSLRNSPSRKEPARIPKWYKSTVFQRKLHRLIDLRFSVPRTSLKSYWNPFPDEPS